MNDRLGDAFRSVAATMDVQARAWIIGIGLLLDAATPDLPDVLSAAFEDEEFPSGPYPLGLSDLTLSAAPPSAAAPEGLAAQSGFAWQIAPAAGGALSVSQTRSGFLDDGSKRPTHVMLCDVESVLSDTVHLLESAAGVIGYAGPRRLLVGIACEVPGQSLELRVFDEGGGDNLRPAAGYTEFEPVITDYPGPLSAQERDDLLWETALAISLAFGVFIPQMVGQARSRLEYPFGMGGTSGLDGVTRISGVGPIL